jgi:hypothetical protein
MSQWVLFASIVALGILVFILWVVPKRQASGVTQDAATRFDKENEARKTLATILGGLAIVITFYSTLATLHTTQEGQITDRYTKAIEELGAEATDGPKLEVRLGGIYALDRIAKDSPKDRQTVDEVLSAYLRRNAVVKPLDVSQQPVGNQNRVDYQAIIRILGSRGKRSADADDKPINLAGVDLTGLSFAGGNYENADFESARLANTNFQKVALSGALLFDADLQGSDLREANLTGADLRGSKLEDAKLGGAILHNTHLERASFLRARLPGTDFSGANLEDAHFEGVDLFEAHGLCTEQIAHINRNNLTRLPKLLQCSQQ